MFRALILSILTLSFAAQAFATPHTPDYYYDQIFADNRLDISIFLGFEQLHSESSNAVIKQVGDAFVATIRDNLNTQRDVQGLDRAITGCPVCGLSKVSESKGYRLYRGEFPYKDRAITINLKLMFSEPGIRMGTLRNSFITALGNDDVVVYLGHSRNGHGFPDFASPITDSGKVYYNDPVQGWVGFERGNFNRQKYQILVLNACQTERYYKNVLRTHLWEKDPSKLAMIMSTDDTWFEDYPETISAMLIGLVTLQSGPEILDALDEAANFYHSMHLTDAVKKKLFSGDGLFDDAYLGRRPPRRIDPIEPWQPMPF